MSGQPEVPWSLSLAKEVRDKSAAHCQGELRRRGLVPESSLLRWAAKQSSWRLWPGLCAFGQRRRCPEGQSCKHTRQGSSTEAAQDICPPVLCSAESPAAVLPPSLGPTAQEGSKAVGVECSAGHEGALRAGALLLWREAERAGRVQPGEDSRESSTYRMCKRVGVALWTRGWSDRTRGNGFTLMEGGARWDILKK